jgi:uncharacterized membrane protein YeaQ/YmgE (transglycosylase-associated protein family)
MAARFLVRFLGWLLTPLISLIGAFAGAWIGATLGASLTSSTAAAWAMLAFGALCGVGAAWAWLRLLRRSPRLQETLAVGPDGTPLAATEGESADRS